ncbi:NmrA family NAD(P)-binding protein [Dyella acidiphila]|uniref:NmrA family NAD(P)-binding protein n=1 Tax=Dyella acidiphila TaxID=2775866 RepID=A0ABR9G8S1_9GAMM|nr:NmrA family NAD(P)-binding protein [Dyella acidiphila]MBE1160416.1 NmrA family NAD(P)-binding protein [Dyella acidiphila]
MIVVTTPTGQIGSQVAGELLKAGEPVRVIVRHVDSLHEQILNQAEVIEGSHGDAAVLDRALEGANALFWVAPPDMTKEIDAAYIEFTRPAAAAIRRHGVKRVISITALGRGTAWQDRAGLVTASLRMDDLLMSTGVAFRGLAMPSFMENIARQVGPMKEKGLCFGPIDPDKKLPLTATRDMASVAAQWLAHDNWTGQHELPVIGPEDLSYNDMAAIISDVTGREIRYQQIGLEQLKQQFIGRGATESFAAGYVDMYRAKNEGMDNAAERDAESRQRITFRQWVERTLKPAMAE